MRNGTSVLSFLGMFEEIGGIPQLFDLFNPDLGLKCSLNVELTHIQAF